MIPNAPGQPMMGNTLGATGSTIAAGTGMNAASLMLRSEANQKEVDELHKRLAVLTEDISHKQTLIDRLLKEVDKRSDAIRTCGVEIVQLRRKNKKLNTDKDEMEKQMKAMVEAEKREAAAISEATEQELTKGGDLNGRELAQRLHIMQEKYKTEKERNVIIMKKLKTLYQQSAKVRHSQQHFAKLEKAHQAQAAYIQNLQTENQKIEVYKSTIRTQERVVAKLEELIETKLKDRKDGGTSTTFRLKQEITRLTQRNQELEKKVFAGGAGGSLAIERVKELEMQLKAARRYGRIGCGVWVVGCGLWVVGCGCSLGHLAA
jgi:chromosome segregation ATPase